MKRKDIDYNLLAIFEALYEERHQGRAAERLGITQPAMSQGLSKLRHITSDPLFERRTMEPTAHADQLYEQIHPGLDLIRATLQRGSGFDPATAAVQFTISLNHGGAIRLKQLYYALQDQAPHSRLIARTIDHLGELPNLLRQREIDVAITHAKINDSALAMEPLRSRDLVLISRINHPRLTSQPDLAALEQEQFAGVHLDPANVDGDTHSSLRQLLLTRTKLEVTSAMVLLSIVAETELLAVTTRELAEVGANLHPLRIQTLPFPCAPIPVYLFWHHKHNRLAGHAWFRELVKRVW